MTSKDSGIWRGLTIVSLFMASLGLVVVVVLPGPQGEVGPAGPQGEQGIQGPQGLAGPNAIIEIGGSGDTVSIGSVCTHYSFAEVTIAVPSNGTVIVTAQMQILINHTYGVEDSWRLVVGESPTDCAGSTDRWRGSISDNSTTDLSVDRTGAPKRVFTVTAGTYTYYANGYMVSGQDDGDLFWYCKMIAVFYPS